MTTPTTEHASVVLGVWQYGAAKGIAENGQEGQTAHQWRDVACRRSLRSARSRRSWCRTFGREHLSPVNLTILHGVKSDPFHTNPMRKRGNALRSSLTHRVSVKTGRAEFIEYNRTTEAATQSHSARGIALQSCAERAGDSSCLCKCLGWPWRWHLKKPRETICAACRWSARSPGPPRDFLEKLRRARHSGSSNTQKRS
jgi:hypothetical protein